MSLFCPGVSWGRRRKALTRGASQRRRRTAAVSRGPSTGSQDSAACGCVAKKRRYQEHHPDDTNKSHGSDGFYFGTENNNNIVSSSSGPGVHSIIYFDDTLPMKSGQRQNPEENSNKTFPPNRRYLPTSGNVNIDNIDAISLHSLAGATIESTPERLKSLVSDSTTPPTYQNHVNHELSGLPAQLSGLCYTSTPAPKNRDTGLNASNPQVITASSETSHFTQTRMQMPPRYLRRDSEDAINFLSNNAASNTMAKQAQPDAEYNRREFTNVSSCGLFSDASNTMATTTKPTNPEGLSTPKSRQPLRRVSFNTPPFPLVTPRNERRRQESVASIYDNCPENSKENLAGLLPVSPRSTASTTKRVDLSRKKSDLRRQALMRNFHYKPIQIQGTIDDDSMNQSASRLAARKASVEDVCQIISASQQYNEQSPPQNPTPMTPNNFITSRELHEFDKFLKEIEEMSLYEETTMSSGKTDESPSDSDPESGSDSTRGVDGRIIRQPVSAFACDGGVSKYVAPVGTSKPDVSQSSTAAKQDRSWSYASPRLTKSPLQFAKPLQHGHTPRQFRRSSAPNVRTIPNRHLSQQAKRKIQNTPLRPQQIDMIPEEVEPADTTVATASSPLFKHKNMNPSNHHGLYKEHCAQGLALVDYAKQRYCDVSVRRGQELKVLNMEDGDWIYVQLDDGLNTEGFVPRSHVFITPLKGLQARNNRSMFHLNQSATTTDDFKVQKIEEECRAAVSSTLPSRSGYISSHLNPLDNRQAENQHRNDPSDSYGLMMTYV